MTINNEDLHSVPHNKGGTTVNASPFNGVKFDLGIILILAVFVLIIVSAAEPNFLAQFLYLAAYGIASMAWLVVKIRKVNYSLEHAAKDFNGKI